MLLVLAGLIVLSVVLWYLISFLLSFMSVPVFLGILAVLLVLGRFMLPVLFDVLVPDRQWERKEKEAAKAAKAATLHYHQGRWLGRLLGACSTW
jgi:fatty acid desaturase